MTNTEEILTCAQALVAANWDYDGCECDICKKLLQQECPLFERLADAYVALAAAHK